MQFESLHSQMTGRRPRYVMASIRERRRSLAARKTDCMPRSVSIHELCRRDTAANAALGARIQLARSFRWLARVFLHHDEAHVSLDDAIDALVHVFLEHCKALNRSSSARKRGHA
jgi:hypothetical protein